MKKIVLILIMSIFVLFGCSGDFILQTKYTNEDKKIADLIDKDTISNSVYVNKTYKVGNDIPEGEYYIMVVDEEKPGYFAISRDKDGEEVIYNDYITNHSYATVSNGQYLTLADVIAKPVVEIDPITSASGVRGDGVYKVGKDLAIGSYKIVPQKNQTSGLYFYYAIYSDSTYENIVASGLLDSEGVAYITLKDGEYVMLNNVDIEAYQ